MKLLPFDETENDAILYLLIVYNFLVMIAIFFIQHVEIGYDFVIRSIGALLKKQQFCEGAMSRQKVTAADEVLEEHEQIQQIFSKKEMNQYALIVKQLTKQYGARLAVNKMSFKVEKGQFYGLLGLLLAVKFVIIFCRNQM